MKKIFIQGYGFFKFENPFRKKKMQVSFENKFFLFQVERTKNQETDCN
jgi:hypothetical protein